MMMRIGCCIVCCWLLAQGTFAQKRGPLEVYFFPYQELMEPKIYRYVNIDDPNDLIYQYCHTRVINGDTILLLKRFDDRLVELETLVQVVTDTGVYLQSYQLYIGGELIKSRVLKDQVYPWRLPKRDSIKWSTRFASVYGEESFRKMRRLIRRHWNYPYAAEQHRAICFRDDFRHSVKNRYGVQTTDFYQYATYAKGLGLVAYDRTLASGKKLRFRLDKILDLPNWERLQRRPPKEDVPLRRT